MIYVYGHFRDDVPILMAKSNKTGTDAEGGNFLVVSYMCVILLYES
jgi:hypothetical protein